MTDQVIDVPLSQIKILKGWNPRGDALDQGRIDALGQEILQAGQLVPTILVPTGDAKQPYRMVDGHRRYYAIQGNAEKQKGSPAPTIKAIVRPNESEKETFLVALMSSIAREDLSTYAVARSIQRAKVDYKVSASELADRVTGVSKGFSKAHINNLVRALERLHKKILKAWEQEHPSCTLANVIKWAALKPESDEQLAAFEAVSENTPVTPREPGQGKAKGKGGDKQPRVSREKLEAAQVWIKGQLKSGALSKHLTEAYEAVQAALRFALGAESVKVGDAVLYDPAALAAEADRVEEEQKAKVESAALEAKIKEASEKAAQKVRDEAAKREADRKLGKAAKKSNGKA